MLRINFVRVGYHSRQQNPIFYDPFSICYLVHFFKFTKLLPIYTQLHRMPSVEKSKQD